MKKQTKPMREGAVSVKRKSSRTAAVAGVMRSKPKTAYELLERVCEHILEEPRRYNQGLWITRGKRLLNFLSVRVKSVAESAPPCGTMACRAGWIAALHDGPAAAMGHRMRTDDIPGRARLILDMEFDDTRDLFSGDAVVGKFGTAAYAKRGAEGLRKFMAEYESHLKARLLSDVPKLGAKP